jgi:hypothetical protein
MNQLPDSKDRQAAVVRKQKPILERVYAFPFGTLNNVLGFNPFGIPRMSGVWFTN